MVDYNSLDDFFVGPAIQIEVNAGGNFIVPGNEVFSVFYKLDENYYYNVTNGGFAQVREEGVPIDGYISYIIFKGNLAKVETKHDIIDNTSIIRRLRFDSQKVRDSYNNVRQGL